MPADKKDVSRPKNSEKDTVVAETRQKLKKDRSARLEGTIDESRKNDLDLPSQTKTT
jgi:hypothetical protein